MPVGDGLPAVVDSLVEIDRGIVAEKPKAAVQILRVKSVQIGLRQGFQICFGRGFIFISGIVLLSMS